MNDSDELTTALFAAVLKEDKGEILNLLEQGADPNCTNFTGQTVLQVACLACPTDKLSSIEVLLGNGADPNRRMTIRSPVNGRVEKDVVAVHYMTSPAAVDLLLRAGADFTLRDADGTNALMRAAFHGHKEVVEKLLSLGMSPLERQTKEGGKTACEMAESKMEMWKEIQNESRQKHYEEIRRILFEAESRSTTLSTQRTE
jgi:ankyrin repeat protein